MNEEIYIRLVAFPSLATRGATRIDADGNYNVYIDERLSCEQQLRELRHELDHIEKGHFRPEVAVEKAEKDAD